MNDNMAEVSKGAFEICCILYITKYFMSKVELISKLSGNLIA